VTQTLDRPLDTPGAPPPSPPTPRRIPGSSSPRPVRPRDLRAEDILVALGCAASAVAVVWLLFDQFTQLSGVFGFIFCSVVLFLVIYWAVVFQMHGRLVANDRLLSAAVAIGTAILAIPLVLMVVFVVSKGWHLLGLHTFTKDLRGVGPLSPAGSGGLSMAIVGTLEQVGLAIIWGVPAGIITAIFLNEVKGRFSSAVRTVVTAMSGLPSIMAGVFIYTIWVIVLKPLDKTFFNFSGLAGSFAIAIMLVPIITRTTEEVLRVVPGGLREASYALGAPEWRTVWSVVLPTARTGIITAVVLGIARAVGETGPLLFTIFGNNFLNTNPFHGPQSSLTLFLFQNVTSSRASQVALAYNAAFVLLVIVLFLFMVTRILGSSLNRRRRSKEKAV
jgi:phosphate transport system permease protein